MDGLVTAVSVGLLNGENRLELEASAVLFPPNWKGFEAGADTEFAWKPDAAEASTLAPKDDREPENGDAPVAFEVVPN